MGNEEIVRRITEEWHKLAEDAMDFTEEQRSKAGAVGHWNVKEALLHVAAWDVEEVNIVETYLATGEKAENMDQVAEDKLNEDQVDVMREASFEDVWQHFTNSNQLLKNYIDGLEDKDLDSNNYVMESITMNNIEHYMGHREDFRQFKDSL